MSQNAAVKKALAAWFDARGWKPFKFQREVWKAIAEGQSGLLHATTGAGKTYAVWLGALMAFMAESARAARTGRRGKTAARKRLDRVVDHAHAGARRRHAARAAATARVSAPKKQVPPWSAGARSGDTAAAERSAQNQRLPTVLVTTPESLSLLLARADAQSRAGQRAHGRRR
jgi:ATP-dependent Lhr-like helicase